MEKKKYYTTNSSHFTNEHNNYIDMMLWALYKENASYNFDWMPLIAYDSDRDAYYAKNERGQKMLEHLLNIDVIAVVAEDEKEVA